MLPYSPLQPQGPLLVPCPETIFSSLLCGYRRAAGNWCAGWGLQPWDCSSWGGSCSFGSQCHAPGVFFSTLFWLEAYFWYFSYHVPDCWLLDQQNGSHLLSEKLLPVSTGQNCSTGWSPSLGTCKGHRGCKLQGCSCWGHLPVPAGQEGCSSLGAASSLGWVCGVTLSCPAATCLSCSMELALTVGFSLIFPGLLSCRYSSELCCQLEKFCSQAKKPKQPKSCSVLLGCVGLGLDPSAFFFLMKVTLDTEQSS